jgi:serine/threonine protein kinase
MTDKLDQWLASIQASENWVTEPQVNIYRQLLSRFVSDENRFTRGARIGADSFWVEYQATDTLTGTSVNLSRSENPTPEWPDDCGELVTLATNQHPATQKLVAFSFGESSHVPVQIVTEFTPNGSLSEALDSERNKKTAILDATAKSKIIFGIVSGLASLHARGFLHRDLKPFNVLLNERFEPIVSGFALSRPYAGGIALRQQAGTPLYIAPEMWGKDNYDFSIDVFSFAITLYQIFADLGTFDDGKSAKSHGALHQRITEGARYARKPEIPDYHWGVIVRCWTQDPKGRPTFQQLLEEFHDNHGYILPGADQSAVLAYENQVWTSFGAPYTGNSKGKAPQE